LPQKLAKFEKIFEERTQAGFAFSDAYIVNEDLQPRGRLFKEKYGFSERTPKIFLPGQLTKLFFKHRGILGMAIVLRAELWNLIPPAPYYYWTHDGWISFVGSVLMEVANIPEPLVKYRQHSTQVYGLRRSKVLEKLKQLRKRKRMHYAGQAYGWQLALSILASDPVLGINEILLAAVRDKIKFLEDRVQMSNSIMRRLPFIIRDIAKGRYQRYALNAWKSIGIDLVLP
jgi:hypothetical protein